MQLTIEPMPMRVLPTFVAILFLALCNCPAQAQQRGIPIGLLLAALAMSRAPVAPAAPMPVTVIRPATILVTTIPDTQKCLRPRCCKCLRPPHLPNR